MPQKRSSAEPPPVMTWGKATLVLAVCIIVDALRFMFDLFWFFGPAIAALLCTIKASAVVGTTIGGLACGAVSVAAGVAAATAVAALGTVMAMAIGFAGWLIVGGWLAATNPRIFKENALWFVGSLLVSEIPIINVLPAMTFTVWKMYRNQITIEAAGLQSFKKEQETEALQEQQQQRLIQKQIAEQMQVVQQGAAQGAEYTQKIEEAA